MAIELIKISEFPQVSEPGDWIVVSDAAGTGYKISKEDFKEWLGTVTVITDKPIAPTDPAPTMDGTFLPTEPGPYPNAGGLVYDPEGVDAGKYVQFIKNDTVWTKLALDLPQAENKINDWEPEEPEPYNQGDQRIHNGQIWSVVVASTTEEPGTGTDWEPKTDAGVEVVDNLKTPDTNKALSANQGVEIKPRILPEGREFVDIDRPDVIAGYIEVDENLNILFETEESDPIEIDLTTDNSFDRPDLSVAYVDVEGNIIEQEPEGVIGNDKNKLYTVDQQELDRPDISLAIVDSDNRVVWEPKSTAPDTAKDADAYEYVRKFWEPPGQAGISPTTDPMINDYDLLIDAWDDIVANNPTNPELTPYITKSSIGLTSTGNRTIYKYRFAPPSPKKKVLIIGGTHGGEKLYIKMVHEFLKTIASDWFSHAVLEWFRWNIDITVIPSLSPTSMENPENGSRGIMDIQPFPVTWTKSGTTVTITFNAVDFPDTNGRHEAQTLFSGPGIAGKTGITITDSSDEAALRSYAHRIATVVDGQTITVETEEGGAASGTGLLSVWVDPNRNWGTYDNNIWTNFTPENAILRSGTFYYHYENKGLRPISLAETQNLRSLIVGGDFDIVIDTHTPADWHYLEWIASVVPTDFGETIERIKNYAGQFNMEPFDRVTPTSSLLPYPSRYFADSYNQPFFTIEWGGNITSPVASDVTDGLRWLTIVLTELLKLKK